MTTYFAFLRAINTAGRYMQMATLRKLFVDLGFANAQTYIQTGNVIFETALGSSVALENQLEQHLQAVLGYPVATFLRSPAELAEIAACRPFPTVNLAAGEKRYIAFLKAALSPQQQDRLAALQSPGQQFRAVGREVYWLQSLSQGQAIYSGAVLERLLAGPITVRNITTIRKLAAKYAGWSQ